MGADYYYTRAGQRFGPVSAEQLKNMAALGELHVDDMVWKEGMANSIAAARLKGLFPAAMLNPAPPQPVEVPVQPGEFRVADLPPPKPAPAAVEIPRAEPAHLTSSLDEDSQADIMARKAKEAALAAGTDALHAFKIMAANPVGGLKAAFESLGAARAMAAGIVFGAIFALCMLIGGRLYFGSVFGAMEARGAQFQNLPASMQPSFPFMGYVKLLIQGVAVLAIVVGGSAALRKMFHGPGSAQSDIFLAGAALLPCGLAFFLGGILGVLNMELSMAIMLFAFSTTILMLYSGFTTLHNIPSTAATVCVPLILILDAYACKVIWAI